MKVYDNDKIKTYRSLFELANSNVLVGRKDGLLLGIDENTIQELRDTIDNNNYLHRENDRLNNIINELEKYIKTEIPEDDFINSELCVNILDKLKELKEGK